MVALKAHVFVGDVDRPVLDAGDAHHLGRVLRLRDGELLTVCDGMGHVRPYRYGEPLLADGPAGFVDRPTPPITVAVALTKGDRPEWAVQKLTETGVDEVVLFGAGRSVAKWEGERATRHLDRLRAVAREAAMQCRRAWLPTVSGVATFAEVAARPGACLADVGGAAPSLDRPLVLVGPEGGWTDDERAAGLPSIALGAHVLRAETAAVVAGALLTALRLHLVAPSRE